ncbi:MAG TPA: AAA family ATPase [Solirubrobacterales bacterium]|nr:AAA family ATPase [Solirubrobacterales bacterium]
MHLSSITIKGFKSFPERTRLVFSPGVSVIVGPNGCGKSNVTDAVLWALGEQSPLAVRGQTMQDMIFAGGDGESPRRYAEVEVVLSSDRSAADFPADEEFSEISIRRRLDRKGDGEYRLNGARCRLVDVIEVLAEANLGREMHSVISQGRVEEIVHSKPRERRLLIEEAAGLGKHRKRRRRAQLKLERTQENLDRALDVEREARSRLRPLKRQAQAADIHTRLERESAELRARVCASELHALSGELRSGERAAAGAREARHAVEAELTEVNRRRAEIEERLAERDRERTAAWGRLTALRSAHERLSVRSEALAVHRGELAAELERRRSALGGLAGDPAAGDSGSEDPIGAGLDRIGSALDDAATALRQARAAGGEDERAGAVARVREASRRAAGGAHRVEELLGRRRQDSVEGRIEAAAELLSRLDELLGATAAVRDAVGERSSELERLTLNAGDAEDVTAKLRACSRDEAELQGRLHATGDALTEAEVTAAHLRDRRDEAAAELERIGRRLGREIEAASESLAAPEREEIERKLERLARRREALGPVNPLAEREYAEAREHVERLEEQRHDLESALTELESLITDTDRKIKAAFEATFEATERNFEELIEHLFPGGRGRLRLVREQAPRLVLGGTTDPEQGTADPAGAESGAQEESPSRRRGQEAFAEDEHPAGRDSPADDGVEIEVTPAGKATRRLSLLSGGEKALVALAFVFAVFLARPSPFYILDEVEAALDDANIDRFLQLVRRFSDRAQFVIVTHQKRTMDAADVLYGVSMGRGGITKIVSRRLTRDSEPAGEAAAEAA